MLTKPFYEVTDTIAYGSPYTLRYYNDLESAEIDAETCGGKLAQPSDTIWRVAAR